MRPATNPVWAALLALALALGLSALQLAAAQQPPAAADNGGGGGNLGGGAAAAANEPDPFSQGLQSPNQTSPDGTQGWGLAPGLGTPGGPPRLKFTGVATVAYKDAPISPFDAVSLGCSLGFVSPTFQSNYVGISNDLFQDGFACGRCIRIQCDDISCKQPGKLDMPALVADLCGSCTKADVSISHPLFANLTGREPGSNPSIVVSWDVVSCSNLTEGTIKMLQKEGGSAFYQAFGFSNSIQPITAVQINGKRLVHESSNWWGYNPGLTIDPAAPLDVALLGGNKEVLRARVPSLRSADLGVQFKAQ